MTWTRLDDTLLGDPRLIEAGNAAELAYVRALVYCNRHLTDGRLPDGALPEILRGMNAAEVDQVPARLVTAGLWAPVNVDHQARGFRVVDFHDTQPSKKQVLRTRVANRDRQRRFRGEG